MTELLHAVGSVVGCRKEVIVVFPVGLAFSAVVTDFTGTVSRGLVVCSESSLPLRIAQLAALVSIAVSFLAFED